MERVACAVSVPTYRKYAKKYGIRLTNVTRHMRKYRTSKELSKDIKNHEKRHSCKNGLYY